jgi:RNA polymerase sigma factor (TIGR02999 family)
MPRNASSRHASSRPDRSRRRFTELLEAWGGGDEEAGELLIPRVYDELRRIAARYLRAERADHTLEPTALVHEAYLRLVRQREVGRHGRAHFLALASRTMRRVLVDHARHHLAAKRGAGEKLPIISSLDLAIERPPELVALDDALDRLAELDPEKARLVELRFFGGLTLDETADALGCGPATVSRQWRTARAWLYRQLSEDADPGAGGDGG